MKVAIALGLRNLNNGIKISLCKPMWADPLTGLEGSRPHSAWHLSCSDLQ